MIAQVCQEWHRFPWELDDAPADEFIKMLNILGLYHKHYNSKARSPGA
jgi:hypothetical protein